MQERTPLRARAAVESAAANVGATAQSTAADVEATVRSVAAEVERSLATATDQSLATAAELSGRIGDELGSLRARAERLIIRSPGLALGLALVGGFALGLGLRRALLRRQEVTRG